ncbi:hypothetical protein NECAME_01200 [Necator americanus]|uniref:C-type lectin domain-containing protein n=1 Tax=Necator americanus TaxID=51031 RepID=W2TYV8_NECAM|nr:hypothetical protein NECAME_01200 [Necator americanus]ETN87043.1 hypothetical protein NECAME_01200 [Necator americanus]
MVWLGGRKNPPPLNDKWTFTDGSPFDYTNWDTGEPNNYDGKENCLQLLFDQNIGREEKRWNDITCDSRMPHFYRLYAEAVVKAAVENGASHLDISGELAE